MADTLRKRYLRGAYEDFCFKSHSSDPPLIYSHVQWAENNNSSYKQKTAKMALLVEINLAAVRANSIHRVKFHVSINSVTLSTLYRDYSYTESLYLDLKRDGCAQG